MEQQQPNRPMKRPKVVFARRAGDAQTVAEAPTITPISGLISIPTTPITTQDINGSAPTKVAIFKPKGLPGRPSLPAKNELRLPPGYQTLRVHGKNVYSKEVGEAFVECYYECGGSFTRACRKMSVKFSAALSWKQDHPEFMAALNEVDQIIKDEIHSQFMERVLNTWEPNPAWKFKYFNKHFPEYSDTKKSVKITFDLKDTLIKPEVIEGEVIKPKQLEAGDATGPEFPVDEPANAGQVLQSD